MNDEISFVYIDRRGKEEPGRGSVVLWDVYACFWAEAYESLFVGRDSATCEAWFLYFRMGGSWKDNIQRILDRGYFPMLLLKSFVCHILFNEMEDSVLLDSFMNYFADDEKNLLTLVMSTTDETLF